MFRRQWPHPAPSFRSRSAARFTRRPLPRCHSFHTAMSGQEASKMSRYFTEDHEWVDVDGDVGTVGISEYAQSQLGDVVFVDVPEAGKTLTKGDEAAVVESVKAASDVYSPVSGTVTEGNAALTDDSSLVNSDAEAAG